MRTFVVKTNKGLELTRNLQLPEAPKIKTHIDIPGMGSRKVEGGGWEDDTRSQWVIYVESKTSDPKTGNVVGGTRSENV